MKADERAHFSHVTNERIHRFDYLLFWALAIFVVISPRTAGAHALPSQARLQEGIRMAEAVRVDRATRLEGALGDPLCISAKPITDFRQQEPEEGQRATEQTEVRILYTSH